MGAIRDYLTFRRLLMPFILQVLFWAGIGGTLYGAYWLFTHDNWAWWMALVFGTLMTRLIFESLLVRFKMYECLMAIGGHLEQGHSEGDATAN